MQDIVQLYEAFGQYQDVSYIRDQINLSPFAEVLVGNDEARKTANYEKSVQLLTEFLENASDLEDKFHCYAELALTQLLMSDKNLISTINELDSLVQQYPEIVQRYGYFVYLKVKTLLAQRSGELETATQLINKATTHSLIHPFQEVNFMVNSVNILWAKGNLEHSRIVIEEGLELSESNNYIKHKGEFSNLMAGYFVMSGNPHDAIPWMEKSIDIMKDIATPIQLGNHYNNLGIVYQRCYEIDKAILYYQKGLELRRNVGNSQAILNSLVNLASLNHQIGNFKNFENIFDEAYPIAVELEDIKHQSILLHDLGHFHIHRGNNEIAIEQYQKALELERKIGNPHEIAHIQESLATAYKKSGQIEKAIQVQQEVIKVRRIDAPPQQYGFSLYNIIKILSVLKDRHSIKNYLEELLEVDEDNTNPMLNHAKLISKALYHLASTRGTEIFKARPYLDEIKNGEMVYFPITITAIIESMHLSLMEMKISNDNTIVEEINEMISRLTLISQENNLYLLHIETKLLEARFEMIIANYEHAFDLVDEAEKIADQYEISAGKKEISNFKQEIGEDITQVKKLLNSNLSERLDESKFFDYLEFVISKST